MTPAALDGPSFIRYPPLGARLAIEHLDLLRRLPLLVLPSFLEQIIAFDWKFPAERERLQGQLRALQSLDAESFRKRTLPFQAITLPGQLASSDWLNQPAHFIQALTPYLWSTRQIDAYREAAAELLAGLPDSASTLPSQSRLVLFTARPEMTADYPLFLKLRSHGLHFQKVRNDGVEQWPLEILAARAGTTREAYAHWYLDGGAAWKPAAEGVHTLGYRMAEPVRKTVLAKMDRAIRSGTGPEILHQQLAALQPTECGAQAVTPNPLLQRFVVDLFTQGSGTQIYSTSFVQWAAREILRRAQPQTLVVRAASRVRGQDLNDLAAGKQSESDLDHAGSLVDSDMAAYYTWLELRKLPGAETAVFLAWFPGREEAFVSSPSVPSNVASGSPIAISGVVQMALAR
jgi:hypothetical protein